MKKILLVLLILAGIGGSVGYYLWNKPVESMATRTTDLAIPADQLLSAFVTDESAANAKYNGKIINVSGKVLEGRDVEGTIKVTLAAGAEGSTVQCEFDPNTKHVRTTFTPGEQITIKGECAGKDIDDTVLMSRCVEVK